MKKQYFVWGQNNFGQAGVGSNTKKQIFNPTEVYEDFDWRSISIGQNFVVAVRNDGTLWAWGSNSNGIFGSSYKLSEFFLSPVCLDQDTTWDSVSCGKKHVIALKFLPNGKKSLWAWGSNNVGQLGIGAKVPIVYEPTNISSKLTLPKYWRKIACGGEHSLAIDEDGNLYASGNNASGQLGVMSQPTGTPSFLKVTTDLKFSNVSCGDLFSVGIDEKGTLWAWGNNSLGQLGIGTTERTRKISKVDTKESNVLNVSCGSNFTIFSSINGLYGFGSNSNGQLGTSNKKPILTPQEIKILSDNLSKNELGDSILWNNLSCGDTHWAAIRTNTNKNQSNLFLAGSNEFGQIGEDNSVLNKVIKGNTVFKHALSDMWQTVVCGHNSTIGSTYPVPVSIVESSDDTINLNSDEVVSLFVKTRGSAPIEYKWLIDNGSGYVETDPPVYTNNITINNEGKYQCKVSNFSGTVYSKVFTVNKFSTPKIIYFSPAQTNLKLQAVADRSTLLELVVSVSAVADAITKTTQNPTTDFFFDWTLNGKSIGGKILKRGRSMASNKNSCKATDTLKLSKDFIPGVYTCFISNRYGTIKTQDWIISKFSEVRLLNEFPSKITISDLDPLPIIIANTTGEDSVNYQWYIDGEEYAGANTNNLKLDKSGKYLLKIFNSNYEVKSNEIDFTILPNFEIVSHPEDINKTVESAETKGIKLSIKTKGNIVKNNTIEPPFYQWYKNDIAISGANESTIYLQGNDLDGKYHCSILNANLKSNYSFVSLKKTPQIINCPSIIEVLNKKNYSNKIQVDFTGDLPANITWLKHSEADDSKKIFAKKEIDSKEFSENISIYSAFIEISELGKYSCIIENKSGKCISKIIDAIEYRPAEIVEFFGNQNFNEPKLFINKQKGPHQAHLQIKALGSGSLTYKWQRKVGKVWSDLPESGDTLLTNFPGQYKCSVTNLVKPKTEKASSQIFTVLENQPPIIISEPAKRYIIKENSTTILSCEVSVPDEEEVSYQWYLNGNALSGVDSFTKTLSAHSQGNYFCKIENLYGEVSTSTTSLILEEPQAYDYTAPSSLLVQKNKEYKQDGATALAAIANKHNLPHSVGCFAGYNSSFFIDENNTLFGVGFNENLELGVKTFNENGLNLIPSWTPLFENVQSVFCGSTHTLIINNDGELFSSGDNSYNQTGSSFDSDFISLNLLSYGSSQWKKISEFPSPIKKIACGSNHTLVLLENGDLYGSGFNKQGQLATQLSYTSSNFSLTDWTLISSNASDIAASGDNSYYLSNNGILYGCGNNTYKQLLDTDSDNYYNWVSISTEDTTGTIQLYSGLNNVFCLKDTGQLYAKGLNQYDQLGISLGDEIVKVFTLVTTDVMEVSCGLNHTLLLKSDNTLYACGQNIYGQLGLSFNSPSETLTAVSPVGDCQYFAAGGRHSLYVDTNNALNSSGFNQYGQLGLDTMLLKIDDSESYLSQNILHFNFNDFNKWCKSVNTNFYNSLINNQILDFDVLGDVFYILTKDAFLLEKFKYSPSDDPTLNEKIIPISKFSKLQVVDISDLNEGLPSYWRSDNNIFIANIKTLQQSNPNQFSFLLKLFTFECESGTLIESLNEIISFDYGYALAQGWDNTSYKIHSPILSSCEKNSSYNVSFSILNHAKEIGLVSIDLNQDYSHSKFHFSIKKIHQFLPWFLEINSNSQPSLVPQFTLKFSKLPKINSTIEITPTFFVEESGLTYEWYKDGFLLVDKTSSFLVLENLSLVDAGFYELKASNSFGSSYDGIWLKY